MSIVLECVFGYGLHCGFPSAYGMTFSFDNYVQVFAWVLEVFFSVCSVNYLSLFWIGGWGVKNNFMPSLACVANYPRNLNSNWICLNYPVPAEKMLHMCSCLASVWKSPLDS